jgi:hypothetical protein
MEEVNQIVAVLKHHKVLFKEVSLSTDQIEFTPKGKRYYKEKYED